MKVKQDGKMSPGMVAEIFKVTGYIDISMDKFLEIWFPQLAGLATQYKPEESDVDNIKGAVDYGARVNRIEEGTLEDQEQTILSSLKLFENPELGSKFEKFFQKTKTDVYSAAGYYDTEIVGAYMEMQGVFPFVSETDKLSTAYIVGVMLENMEIPFTHYIESNPMLAIMRTPGSCFDIPFDYTNPGLGEHHNLKVPPMIKRYKQVFNEKEFEKDDVKKAVAYSLATHTIFSNGYPKLLMGKAIEILMNQYEHGEKTLNTGYAITGFRDVYFGVDNDEIRVTTDIVHQPASAYDIGAFGKMVECTTGCKRDFFVNVDSQFK